MNSRFTLLAILQQAEYDLDIWQAWQEKKRSKQSEKKLQTLQPEKWTTKLKIINKLSQIYGLLLPTSNAIRLAVQTLRPIEKIAVALIVWLAAQKLRRLQKRGLTVIGVAGSYGKTSVKHLLQHTFAHQWFTLATPASYNTPLGISLTILRKLHGQHQIFIAEMGEYQSGDLQELLDWIRPNIGIITPIGFAHSDRFGTTEKMVATFQEMLTSRRAPALLLIDDSNRGKIPDDDQVIWYGDAPRSEAYLKNVQVSEQGSQGWLHWKNKKREIATRLWGEHQLRNALPGIILTQHLQGKPEVAIIGLRYAPDIPRRLAITRNANGTVLIDNSYNSNPGSWKEMFALLQKLSLPNLALITSGFVELEHDLQTTEHHKLAQELAQVAQTVVIIRTQDNSTLIQELPHLLTDVMIVDSFPEALQALQTSSRPISYLWIEGGSRELYA